MRKFKKFLAALSVAVLAASSLAGTALAGESKSFSSVKAGEDGIEAGLSCYTSAMGGIDFSEGMVDGAAVTTSSTPDDDNNTTGGDDSTSGDNNTSGDDNTADDAKNTLESGTYAVDLTWIPVMDNMMDPIVEIDAENNTFKVYNAAAPETDKGSGKITFDAATGEYTLTYETGVKDENVGATTTASYDAEKDTVTFISPLLYGTASFSQTDEAGNFVPYTAVAATLSTPDDDDSTTGGDDSTGGDNNTSGDDSTTGDIDNTLESGTYAVDLTWIPVMDNMMDPIVEIDAANMTFKVYNAAAPETDKGSGKITFDAATGEYTLTYETGVKDENVGATTTAAYDAEKDTITFTSALLYGTASFSQTDEAGNFVPYTAVATTLSTPDDDDSTTGGDNSTGGDDNNTGGDDSTSGDDNTTGGDNNAAGGDNTTDNTNNGASDNNGTVSGSDTDKDVPKTGDVSNFGLLFAVVVAGLAIVIVGKRYEKAA